MLEERAAHAHEERTRGEHALPDGVDGRVTPAPCMRSAAAASHEELDNEVDELLRERRDRMLGLAGGDGGSGDVAPMYVVCFVFHRGCSGNVLFMHLIRLAVFGCSGDGVPSVHVVRLWVPTGSGDKILSMPQLTAGGHSGGIHRSADDGSVVGACRRVCDG